MAGTVTFLLVEELRAPWREFALCKGMSTTPAEAELFYPARAALTEPAKILCAQCPVAQPCLEFALRTVERQGVWGGTSERERRKMRKAIKEAEARGEPWPDWIKPISTAPKVPRRRPWRLPGEDRMRREVRERRLALLEVA